MSDGVVVENLETVASESISSYCVGSTASTSASPSTTSEDVPGDVKSFSTPNVDGAVVVVDVDDDFCCCGSRDVVKGGRGVDLFV